MKIFLDTNILLDILCKREPFYINGAKIWTLIKEGAIKGFISAIYINNLYYIVKKIKYQKIAKNFIEELLNDFEIVPLTKDLLSQAITITKKDYEDSIQYFSAINTGCKILITRNKKDFPSTGIRILSSTEFIKTIKITRQS